jgi:hypothetical protein
MFEQWNAREAMRLKVDGRPCREPRAASAESRHILEFTGAAA